MVPWDWLDLSTVWTCRVGRIMQVLDTFSHVWHQLLEPCLFRLMMFCWTISKRMDSLLNPHGLQFFLSLLVHIAWLSSELLADLSLITSCVQHLNIWISVTCRYAPIIPMVLVNGSEGIGTGWSSFVPNYNPRDIVANLHHLLKDEPMEPMHPWYKGFKVQQAQTLYSGRFD